jgi:hypothetical protein
LIPRRIAGGTTLTPRGARCYKRPSSTATGAFPVAFLLQYRSIMSSRRLSAGDFIEARCTRCRTVTNHTVIAMVEDRPVRVRCNTCNGDHNYRPPQQKQVAARTRTVSTRPTRSTAKSRAAADQDQLQEILNQAEPDLALPYSMDRAYKPGQIVSHPVFGLGVVKEVLKPDKVEILFTCGKKLLRCKL